jgi:hypothetical protein
MVPENQFGNIEIRRTFDLETRTFETSHYLNGEPIPQVPLSGPLAIQGAGLGLIMGDLTSGLRWMQRVEQILVAEGYDGRPGTNRFKDRETGDEVKGLFIASLSFYAKAFTEAGGRRLKMQKEWLDESFRNTHEYFMIFRHNLAAHSGDQKIEQANLYLILVPAGTDTTDFRLFTDRLQPDLALRDPAGNTFLSLIAHARSKVEERFEKLTERVLKVVVQRDVDFWRNAARKNEAVDLTIV